MERDYGGATSPPLSDGESHGSTAAKLSALFAMEQQKLQSGNSSFRYHPPKLPALPSTIAKGVTPVAGFATNMPGPSELYNSAPSLQVLHSVAVLQLLISDPSGGENFIGNAGMAILETSTSQTKSYQLVLYDASKRTLANTSINQDFQCTLKAEGWINFISMNQSWSALFNSTEDWVDFARAVVLARSLVDRSSHSFSDVIIQDISPQPDIPHAGLREGDMVQVTYKAWMERPGFPGTLGHCFQETAGKGKKLELGSGKSIKGLEQGVIGMTKGSRRLVLIPPQLAYGSSSERPDRVHDDAVVFFDVTVSRTRRHKGPASEASFSGRELLSDQHSYNGDAGFEREEITASNFPSVNIHDELTMVNAGTVFKNVTEENAQEEKDLTYEKELLIDRMAKLSRIGGAGSYNLPPSSVVHHKRFSIEHSQPSSPSTVVATHTKFTIETSQFSSDGVDRSRDPSNQKCSIGVVDPDINDTLNSTTISTLSNEDTNDHEVNLQEEDKRSHSGNHLPEQSNVEDEVQLVSNAKDSQNVDCEYPKLGDAEAEVPSGANEHQEKVGNPLNSSAAEVVDHSQTSNSFCVPMTTGTVIPLSNHEVLGPQSAQSTVPTSSPALIAPWSQGSAFPYPPFAFPNVIGTLPSNSNEVPPFSVINPATQFQPMGPLPYAPTALPGQSTQPYIGHPALFPWFPWGFPQYGPPPCYIPAAESKCENQELQVLKNIQQAQESMAESLKNLTIKVEALTEVCHNLSRRHENEQSSVHSSLRLEAGSKGSIFQDQISSDDGDNQVDSLVESVALMLAENKELRRRLSEYKLQSPSGMGPSIEQYTHHLVPSTIDNKWLEDPGSSSRLPPLNLAGKTHPDLEFEPATTLSSRDVSSSEAEQTMNFENKMKLVMNQVHSEVEEELRHSEDVDESLPVVRKKVMDGMDDVIKILHEKSLFADSKKTSSSLRSPKAKDTHADTHPGGFGITTDAGLEAGAGSELNVIKLDDVSLEGLTRSDDCSELADYEEFKMFPEGRNCEDSRDALRIQPMTEKSRWTV